MFFLVLSLLPLDETGSSQFVLNQLGLISLSPDPFCPFSTGPCFIGPLEVCPFVSSPCFISDETHSTTSFLLPSAELVEEQMTHSLFQFFSSNLVLLLFQLFIQHFIDYMAMPFIKFQIHASSEN